MKKLWCVVAAVAAASAGADVTVFDGGAAKTAIEEGAWTVSGDFDLSSCGRLTVEFAEPLPQATRLEIQVLGEHPVEALSNGTGGGRDIGQFFVYSLPSDACTSLTVNLPPDVPAFRDVLNRMVGVRPWGLWRRLWKDPAMREVGSCKWWSVDPKRVKGVRVIRLGRTVASLKYPGVAPAIAVKRVTAHGDPARIEAKDLPAWAKMSADRFYPFLDKYGQFKWYDWPGKVRSDADLAAARTAEEKDLAAHPGPANRDKWGGWANGPKRSADGTWRTAKENGKWWIVDPDGNLWWSHGVVRVSHSCGMSPVKGREDHFEGLPEAGDEFAAFYRTRDELLWPYYVKYGCTNTYDFTAANLRRKYGPDWENVWGERVHRRLRSWGANTIANSSDRKVTARGGTPYCDRFEIKSKPIAGTTSLLAWWPFRDPFDPSFRADIRRQLEIHRAELADPWCFGFFVDNELQWGDETDLAKWTWASPDDQAAKVAFKAWLKARHGAVPAKPSDDDCRAFSLEIVRAYFSTVREEVKAAAPGKLYLGCRFSGAEAFVIDEAQKYCDVMSFNHYDRDVKALVDSWPKGFDKPVMIGEFHFGALDRGPFTTGIISLDGGQAERAQTYVRYLTSALENPCIVGTHWHQYADDVSTGRFDGENMQIGWTDVCDTPYAETIAAVRDIGERMYAIRTASGVPLEKSVALSFGAAQLVCKEPGAWRFATSVVREAEVDVVTVTLAADAPAVPPEFEFTFDVSGAGAYDVWTSPFQAGTTLYPSYWAQWRYPSQLAESLPLVSAFGHDTNVLTVVSSEALRKVLTRMAFDPKTDRLAAGFKYFTEPEAPLAAYSVKMRLDRRRTFWADAVSSGADWMARAGGHAPAAVPSAAYEPLYSTWYAFWQDVHADVLERELAAAAKLGMKTAILDDGWQKEESRKYYSKTGDWQPVASRFPDMKGHVARVHRLGLKYMLWLSVPYVGDESAAWSRFQGKFLHYDRGSGAGVLDPRFPEVREHLIATYERVVRDWGFDGLKLDFIDEFRIRDEGDPAVKENYAGRDIRSVPEATDRLMTDILARLRAIKPDVLVEFRQNYVGPAIRKYGNMLRAADVPYNYRSNRKRIADLRLTSGKTAVHSDMLGWSPEETPEGASLPILNTIFATVQYSMKLGKLPAEQQDVIRHWIDFARVHREALLLGSFEAHHAELGYPLLAGEGAAERIVGVYADSTVAKTAADKPTILLNATTASKLVVDFAADASVETFDCRGRRVGSEKVARGLSRLAVPPSGYAVVK